jgi:hypothetical protein
MYKSVNGKWERVRVALIAALLASASAILAVRFVRGLPVEKGSRASSAKTASIQGQGTAVFHQQTVPHLSAARPTLSLRPGEPQYDPVRLIGVMRVKDIFTQEPRNARWAGEMEPWLSMNARKDLVKVSPGLTDLQVECKTTMCRFSWFAPAQEGPAVEQALRALYIGAASGRGATKNEWIIVYAGGVFSDVPQGDAAALKRKMITVRRKQLSGIKGVIAAGQRTNYRDVPNSAWPSE